jgi:hypothetical protein
MNGDNRKPISNAVVMNGNSDISVDLVATPIWDAGEE